MAKTRKNKNDKSTGSAADTVYLLKLALLLVVGSFWIKITRGEAAQLPIPAGFLIGLLAASHERFAIDRKIQFAILLVSMLVGFWLPYGIFVALV